jgi:hypothetical protein
MHASHAFAALQQFDAIKTTKLAGVAALADG